MNRPADRVFPSSFLLPSFPQLLPRSVGRPMLTSLVAGLCVAIVASALHAATITDMKEARSKAAWKPRPILLNNDGNDSRGAKTQTREAFLATRAVPFSKTKANAMCYCTGVWGVFTHPCADSQLREARDRSEKEWAAHLSKDGGPDSLGSMVEFCHRHDKELFWSVRMNDTHDSADGSLLSQWKKDHLDLLVGQRGTRYPFGSNRWSAADYSHEAVRDRPVAWLDDVAKRYDVDGFELDFFRHAVIFKEQMKGRPVSDARRDEMTAMIRRMRENADRRGMERGRPVLIAVRVPDSSEYCRALGLDVDRWMSEGLIDMLIVSGYFRLNPWKTSAEWGHRYHVPVFASLDEPRLRRHPELQKIRESIECYRARALDAWRGGVDGIYFFNYEAIHHDLRACNDAESPEALMKMDKLYTTGARERNSAGSYLVNGKKYIHRPPMLPESPANLSTTKPANVSLVVYDEVEKNGGLPTLRILPTEQVTPEQVLVSVNGRVLTGGKQDGRWIEWTIEPSWITTGENQFAVSLVGEAPKKRVQLRDLLLWVRYGETEG